MSLEIIILAAGLGKRMRSNLPKVLHCLGGVSMLSRVVATARALQPHAIHIVYGNAGEQLQAALSGFEGNWIKQEQQSGTGHAVAQALPQLAADSRALILFADVPLITAQTLQTLCDTTPSDAVGLLLADFADPKGLGRVLRQADGQITAIVEDKDASESQRKIKEIFSGMMLAPTAKLKQWLSDVGNDNGQGEYYLTDIVALAVAQGCSVVGIQTACPRQVQGVNDRAQLSALERDYQRRLARKLQLSGVTIMDPNRFDVRGELSCAQDVSIDINVIIAGQVTIGENTTIGPNCTIRDARIGKNVTIKANSVIEGVVIGDDCIVGPFARIRPETELAARVHVGNFVEIKKSTIDTGTKINHLSYIGDASIGKAVNIGAGTITCNYDGVNKHRTIIEDGVFIGSDTQLIAPVTVGANATIGAGATIRKDAPADKLTVNDTRQKTIVDWQPDSKS